MKGFRYQEMLPIGADAAPYKLLTKDHVSTWSANGKTFVQASRQRSAKHVQAGVLPSSGASFEYRAPRTGSATPGASSTRYGLPSR